MGRVRTWDSNSCGDATQTGVVNNLGGMEMKKFIVEWEEKFIEIKAKSIESAMDNFANRMFKKYSDLRSEFEWSCVNIFIKEEGESEFREFEVNLELHPEFLFIERKKK
jgi:hypothetical protein